MKQTFGNVALGKKTDLALQVLTFPVMLFLTQVRDVGPFAMYLMALVQTISALLWTIYFWNRVPAFRAGGWIRAIFLVVAAVLILVILAIPHMFLGLSLCMLIAGPPLGIAYFIITISEVRYYNKARKPYYLL